MDCCHVSGVYSECSRSPFVFIHAIEGQHPKNEVHRDDPYNRKLFRRLKHGHYIINPQLAVWVEGAWRPM
jgi:hypothetical protein